MGRVDEAGLIDLWEEIEQDDAFKHLRTPGVRLVPGYGASRPFAMVVGEAPGAQENAQGRPFCGPSGRVLHQLMALAGMYAEGDPYASAEYRAPDYRPNIWLTNAIKYRPPGNRTPIVREILAAQPYLRREWALVGKPRLIVCCGSVARDTLGRHMGPEIVKGELYPLKSGRVWVAYQYHPAYGMRGDDQRKQMIERHWETMGELIGGMSEELGWHG